MRINRNAIALLFYLTKPNRSDIIIDWADNYLLGSGLNIKRYKKTEIAIAIVAVVWLPLRHIKRENYDLRNC